MLRLHVTRSESPYSFWKPNNLYKYLVGGPYDINLDSLPVIIDKNWQETDKNQWEEVLLSSLSNLCSIEIFGRVVCGSLFESTRPFPRDIVQPKFDSSKWLPFKTSSKHANSFFFVIIIFNSNLLPFFVTLRLKMFSGTV